MDPVRIADSKMTTRIAILLFLLLETSLIFLSFFFLRRDILGILSFCEIDLEVFPFIGLL